MFETGKKKDLEFFKVFLPEFSSKELVIPPAFIDILEKPLPNEALLLDEIGRLWFVETKTEDTEERFRVVFQKGWEKFARDQSLEFGDFLVFRYDGDSRFSVAIFAKDGCKKDLTTEKVDINPRVSAEKKPVATKPVDFFTKPVEFSTKPADLSTKPVDFLSKPADLSDKPAGFSDKPPDFPTKPADLSDKPVGFSDKPEYGCGMQRRKWKRSRGFVAVEGFSGLVNDEPENVSNSETDEPECRRRKLNRHEVSSDDISWVPEKKELDQEPVYYKPNNPHFVRRITKTSIHRMEIPTTFLKSNGIELEGDVELCDENRKKWPLKIESDYRGIYLSKDSWLCFCASHKLMNTNKCLFEFLVQSNGRCKEIQVRIYRGRLDTTNSRNGYHVLAL